MQECIVKVSSSDLEFDSIQSAIEAVQTGDTITLLSDITSLDPIVISKRCTFDLNGHVINVTIPSAITIKGGVKVSIDNGSIETMPYDTVENTIFVQGSNTHLTLGSNLKFYSRGTAIHVWKKAKCSIEGSTIKSDGVQPTIIVEGEKSNVVFSEGYLESTARSAVVIESEGKCEALGGVITTKSSGVTPGAAFPAIKVVGREAYLCVDGSKVSSEDTCAIVVDDSAKCDVHSGNIESSSDDYTTIQVSGYSSSLNIDGGSVLSYHESTLLLDGLNFGESNHCIITEGTIGADENVILVSGPGNHDVVVSGGKFKGKLEKDFIKEGYVRSDDYDSEGYSRVVEKTWEGLDSSDDNPYIDGDEPSHDIDFKNPYFTFPTINNVAIEDVEPVPEEVVVVDTSSNNSTKLHDTCKPLHEPCKPLCIPKVIKVNSANIIRKTLIYKSPSRKHPITCWSGVVTIVSGGYMSTNNEEFAMVRFKAPGSGAVATGFIPVCDIANP